jgi:hypothetical protein
VSLLTTISRGENALDYFNGASSVLSDLTPFSTFNQGYFDTASYYYLSTNIYDTTRSFLSRSFYGSAIAHPPFHLYFILRHSYRFTIEEKESMFHWSLCQYSSHTGVHLGGIGQSCGTEGQVWYVENGGTVITNLLILAEMPGGPIGPNNNLEELSFYYRRSLYAVRSRKHCILFCLAECLSLRDESVSVYGTSPSFTFHSRHFRD